MAKRSKSKEYSRIRADSGHHRRILTVMAILAVAAFIPVGLRLYFLMIHSYDQYSQLALRNQTRTTSVTADRGTIYDRNMNILAASVSVENIYLDPHELKQSKADLSAISQKLAQLLQLDATKIVEKAKDLTKRYQLVADRVDEETASKIR